jgi:trehalose-phosphatase
MIESGTAPESSSLVGVLRSRSRAASLFLLLDYDGTLVPICRHPREAVADGELLDLLRRLTGRPGFQAAVVSGRSLADLETVLPSVAGLWRFGNHGGEGQSPEGDRFPTASFEEAETALRNLQDRWRGETWPEGAWLETKDLSLVLHFREAGEREAEEACAAARAAVAAVDGGDRLTLLEGKKVLEAIPVELHKGLAVGWLRGATAGEGVVFVALGDDVTDERTFEALGERDIAIRVGKENRPSAAPWRLEGVKEVRALLDLLLREESVREGETQSGKERA